MQLDRSTFPRERLIGASAPENTGIVHLGLGQFHRAHGAVDTALALAHEPGDWGIVGVAGRSRAIVEGMRAQDNLYSVLELVPGEESVGVVDVHRHTVVGADEPDSVLDALSCPDHRVVTLTISERGYHRTPAGTLDTSALADDIAADLPRSPLGLLAAGLQRRFERGAAPVSVVSCDNMQNNGATTRASVLDLLRARRAPDDVLAWVADDVAFPGTMVDRIVPGTTDETRARVEAVLGLRDEVPVPAERFSMWVLEDRFPAGRPAWEAAGAIFSDEVHAYEVVKLRILNGMHSLMSYVGALDGRETIPQVRSQDAIAHLVRTTIEAECLPSIDLPTDFDADAYVDELFERWSNTALNDRIARIGTEGSVRLPQRIPVPALTALGAGRMPHGMALAVAAWMTCVVPPAGFDAGPVAGAMVEPAVDAMRRALEGATDPTDRARRILGSFFPAELAASEPFARRVGEFLDILESDGAQAAAREAVAARDA